MFKKSKRSIAKKAKKQEKLTFGQQIVSSIRTILGAIIVVMIINGIAVASFVVPTPSMEKTVMTGDFLFVNKFLYGPSSPQVIPFVNIPLPFFRLPGLRDPERGDVIVFIYPGNRDEVEPKEFMYYLKRCIAIGGDTLVIRNKQVFVNGKEMPLPETGMYDYRRPDHPSSFPIGSGFTRDNYGPLVIPKKGDVIQVDGRNMHKWITFIQREGHKVVLGRNGLIIDGQPAIEYTVERDYVFGMGDNRDNSDDSRQWGFVPVENVVGTPMLVYWSWDTNMPFADFFKKLTTIRWSRIGTIIN